MSLLDLLLIGIIGGSVVSAFMAGLARSTFGVAAAIFGVVLACWSYGFPAAFFRQWIDSPALANLLGFFAIFLPVITLGSLAGKVVAKFFKWTGLSWLDRILGAGFGFLRGALIVIAVVLRWSRAVYTLGDCP